MCDAGDRRCCCSPFGNWAGLIRAPYRDLVTRQAGLVLPQRSMNGWLEMLEAVRAVALPRCPSSMRSPIVNSDVPSAAARRRSGTDKFRAPRSVGCGSSCLARAWRPCHSFICFQTCYAGNNKRAIFRTVNRSPYCVRVVDGGDGSSLVQLQVQSTELHILFVQCSHVPCTLASRDHLVCGGLVV